MAKNIQLVDIYVKIYNKQNLTVEDLIFLSMFDPECFGKTCKNLVYNIPEAKTLLEPEQEAEKVVETVAMDVGLQETESEDSTEPETEAKCEIPSYPNSELLPEEVTALLDNLKKIEWDKDIVQDIDSEQVKNLLGSLYMEMLFPHNDKYRFFRLEDHIDSTIFNEKA